MEEKKNGNGWHAVERYIFDSKEYKQLTECDLEDWSELSDIEEHIELQAKRAAALITRLKHLSRFLDYRSRRDRTRNPYAGNCLLVRIPEKGNVKATVCLARRLDDIVPLRYGGAHRIAARSADGSYIGRGEEIDSVLDVNGKLLVRTVPDLDRYEDGFDCMDTSPMELEIRQLTDKGEALIRRCEASYDEGTGSRLDSDGPWDWLFDAPIEGIDLLGKHFNDADGYKLLEELWDLEEYCQVPRYKERYCRSAAFEYERPLGKKVQSLQVKETCDFGEAETRFAVTASTDPLKRSIDRHEFDTMAEALAFCEEEYGLVIEA